MVTEHKCRDFERALAVYRRLLDRDGDRARLDLPSGGTIRYRTDGLRLVRHVEGFDWHSSTFGQLADDLGSAVDHAIVADE